LTQLVAYKGLHKVNQLAVEEVQAQLCVQILILLIVGDRADDSGQVFEKLIDGELDRVVDEFGRNAKEKDLNEIDELEEVYVLFEEEVGGVLEVDEEKLARVAVVLAEVEIGGLDEFERWIVYHVGV
jgi:hypothetical protein